MVTFTAIDGMKHGYLDFEALKRFMGKYKKEILKQDINSILRRIDLDADGKISFSEFSQGITPEHPGLEREHAEFNQERKDEIV